MTEVHSGDTLTIEDAKNNKYKISMTNLKARTIGNPFKHEESQPWAFEAKEHLRKKVIGQKLMVKIDNIRSVKTEDREIDYLNGTIYM